MNKMGNIEHRTSNIEHPMDCRAAFGSALDVGCSLAIYRSWMLDVSNFQEARNG